MSSIEQPLDAQLGLNNPFPGLRPFDIHESELLFGREDEIQELLSRLRRNQFQAVVGSSGCGKSSLVRAGLIASLQDGFMAEPTAPWRIAMMRPGNDPIAQLARALNGERALGCAHADKDESAAMRQAALFRGALGVVEAFEEADLPPGSKLLLLVDQFEELFRFVRETTTAAKNEGNSTDQQTTAVMRRASAADEAQAFVKLLLTAAGSSAPVYVVLTMRSEFLGHCANFPGLPEAINRGLYLLPQMDREQLRDAIEGPVEVCGGKIAPRLVNRLLNDLGDADQLPILQHAMMRMWTEWSPNRARGPIDLEHYKSIGELSASLSDHAEEAYATLTESQKDVAELLFRTITETTEDQQTVRRPAEFSLICEIVRSAREENAAHGKEPASTVEEVTSVIDRFREEGRSFLMPSAGTPLKPHTVIDISHESLIRQWDRLRDWAEKEARFTKLRRRLKVAADEWHEKNRTDATLLYTGARLMEAEEYARDRGTTLTPLEKEFLSASDVQSEVERGRKLDEARREAKNRLYRILTGVLSVAFVITVSAGYLAIKQSNRAQVEQRRAEEAQKKAIQESRLAEQSLKEKLEAYGWQEAQLSNVDDNPTIVQESSDANRRLLQVLGQLNDSDEERRKSILVTYYRKKADKEVVEGVLAGLGFRIDGRTGNTDKPTNIIWVNPEVIDSGAIKLDDVKLIAYALIRAGIQIKRIGPPRYERRNDRSPHIWIGADDTLESRPALTVKQVQNASGFRDEPAIE